MTTKKKPAGPADHKSKNNKGKTMAEPAATAKATMKQPAKVEAKAAAAAQPSPLPATPTVPATVGAALAEAKAPKAAPVAAKAAPVAPAAALATESDKPILTIGMFQKRLYELGFYGGHWDGHYGQLTKEAVCRFQTQQGFYPSGDATPETIAALGL